MKIILQEYKDILIKSSIEKDLIIKNLDENKNFDLYVLKDVEKSIFDNVVSFINNKRKKNFQLNINDIYFENKEKSKVNHWYENRKKRLEAQKKDDIKNIDELNQEKFQRIEQILEMSKLMKACNIGFTNIYKNISSDIKKQICIGYPIIRGKFRDGTFFSTPLILFKVDIQKNLNGFTINKLESSELTINKSLLMGIEKFQNVKHENFDEFYEILNFETIENILKQLQAYDIFTEYYDFGFSEYEYTEEREKVFEINEYKVLNNMIIGEFENINSLYKDYSKLETIDLNNNLLGKILNENNSNSAVVDDEIRTNDLFLYTALDYNEKLAIKTSELNNYIFRSENKDKKFDFLSNFIVNNIAKDKKVLVISENEKFLKNINERLAILENYICKVINEEKDKLNFYEKIKLKLDTMNLENSDYLTDLYEYGNFIDNKVSNLMRLDIILNSEYIKGVSIANLYEYFKKIDINDFKNVTCDLSSLEIFKFGDIVNTCRNIDNKLITAFNGYNKNIKELKFLEEVKVLEIADVNKFDNILNNLCALFGEISSNKEGKDDLYYFLLKKLRTSKFLVSDENIMKLSALINTEKNKILKKKFLSEQWWRDGESDIEIADMLNKRLSNYKYMVTDELISDIASEVNLRRNGHLNKDITLDNVIYIAGADMEMCQRVSELLKENEYEVTNC